MILDGALCCEVSDGSSTAPHLRRADRYDEDGRGLMLVAQLGRALGHPPHQDRQDHLGPAAAPAPPQPLKLHP